MPSAAPSPPSTDCGSWRRPMPPPLTGPARRCSSITPARPPTSIHPATGETRAAYIFMAVLGASNYTYADATWIRDLTDWKAYQSRRPWQMAPAPLSGAAAYEGRSQLEEHTRRRNRHRQRTSRLGVPVWATSAYVRA